MDRPNYIDLGSNDSSRAPSAASRLGLPSPRIHHFDGDVPPSLSPLDAFAAHSRRLAKELEETRIAGQRRMSRLPPQIVTESLSQHQANRPAIFRSLSGNSQEGIPPVPKLEQEPAGSSPTVTDPIARPASAYPFISHVMRSGTEPKQDNKKESQLGQAIAEDYAVPTSLHQISHPSDYFGVPTTESPIQEENPTGGRKSFDAKKRFSQADSASGLAPPTAAFARARLYNESSEDDYASSNAGSFFSHVRKLSSNSGISAPRSPALPAAAHERSPSNNSTTSLAGHRKVPSHLNFSRPRSAASSHSKNSSLTDLQHGVVRRKASNTSEYQPRTQPSFEDTRSVMSEGQLGNHPSSYTHTTFALPRGRADRASAVFSGLSTPHFEWSEPMFPSTPPLSAERDGSFTEPSPQALRRPSHDARSLHSDRNSEREQFSFEFDREPPMLQDQSRRPSSSHTRSSSIRSIGSAIGVRPSTTQGVAHYGAQKIPDLPPIPGSMMGSTQDSHTRSSRSNSTVRPTTSRSISNYQSLSADDHVTKAIELHQHGDLKESTYHLRIAARQDHPTGMLLYALACRHGWGMRSNPKEGVAWLKKAVDSAMLEVADDEDSTSDKPKADFMEKKAHRAQFALSIYELGISHLNGWGVDQDKALALRCFEIAGTWGDPDALTEAGFCYAEGIGCKKDQRKAAKFYRLAAEKGVSMVGNSWIYKDKYNDTTEDKASKSERDGRSPRKVSGNEKDQIPRSKSKSRGIFGRKRSTAAPASS